LFLVVVYGFNLGCDRDAPTAPPDEVSPFIQVLFPAAGGYDRDGDGLIDLEIAFTDTLSGIDLQSVQLTTGFLTGPSPTANDLILRWRVERLDETGLVIEETPEALLRRGQSRVALSVTDRSGNRTTQAISFDLPPAILHKFLPLGLDMFLNTSQITIGPDGRSAYVTVEMVGGTGLVIVDLATLAVRKTVLSPINALSRTVIDTRRNRLYLASIDEPLVGVFDLATETFLPPIAISSRGVGIAISTRRDRVYVGLEIEGVEETGFISVIDPGAGVEEGVIDLGIGSLANPGDHLNMATLLFDETESALYATTSLFAQQGILVINPDLGELSGQIDAWPEHNPYLGFGIDLLITQGLLVATTSHFEGMGRIAVISPPPIPIRFGDIARFLQPKEIAISPDGMELAVTAGDLGIGYGAVRILSFSTLGTIWEDRIPTRGTPRAVNPEDIAFRPDGNVFFMAGGREEISDASPAELYVYLRR
jgi:DNA-binding beta-propeller fold protein YncE